MNRNRKESRRRQEIPVWTYAQAQQVSPYIRSIMRTLREYRLEQIRNEMRLQRLGARPGRPNRASLIEQEEAATEARRAAEKVQDDLHELQELGVCCQDPVAGQALLPFMRGQLLAWLVFDMFSLEPLRAWRYHSDPDEMRRPISEIATEPSVWAMVL